MSENILKIECNDSEGLIYRVTKVLAESGCNITRNGEFVDTANKKFFMRTEFSGSSDLENILTELKDNLPSDSEISIPVKRKKKIVLMVTKEHHCFGDLLVRAQYGELNAEIVAVVSNYDILKPLSDSFDIPFYHISHNDIKRDEHEKKIIKKLDSLEFDYIILAKYMRILTKEFVASYSKRIVNIHHSFLPAFIGASPYKQAYDRGVKIIGATAHFVTDDLDEGPIISQSVIHVDHSDNAEDMARAGRDVEKIVLANALNLVVEDKVFVNGNKTVIFD